MSIEGPMMEMVTASIQRARIDYTMLVDKEAAGEVDDGNEPCLNPLWGKAVEDGYSPLGLLLAYLA